MNITIDLPESYKLYFGDADIEHELKKNRIPVIEYTNDDIDKEFENIRKRI